MLPGFCSGVRVEIHLPQQDAFIDELGLTAYAFSKAIGMNRSGVSDIVNGERAITAESALRFARFFGNSPQFWLNLQDEYNLRVTERRIGHRIAKEVQPYVESS